MQNRKLLVAVFLGLLASTAALISALFMLYQIKTLSKVPNRVDNLTEMVQAINTDVDLEPFNQRINEVVQNVNELGNDVEALKSSQIISTDSTTGVKSENTTNTPQESGIQTPVTPSASNTQTKNETKPVAETKKETVKKPAETKVAKTSASVAKRTNVRTNAGLKSKVTRTSAVGEKFTLMNVSIIKDGYTWIKVKDSKGNTGWIAERYTK